MRASRENAKPSLLRRALACLVSAAMVVAFTPVVAWGEDGVAYLDANGNRQTTSATVVEPSTSEGSVRWNEGWYVAQGDVTIGTEDNPQRVTITGPVYLILADGCNLTVNGGIQVQDNDNNPATPSLNSLTIYGQSKGTGKLTVQNVASNNAGIGGSFNSNNSGNSGGTITISGGAVEATGGNYAAGIGGSNEGNGGQVTISGGAVEATGGNYAAGIGGGSNGGNGGQITISGGTVTATGTDGGAGIGGGFDTSPNGGGGSGGTITISGGTVNATGKSDASRVNGGAGIGGGGGDFNGGSGGTATINGGVVTAIGGGYGAGIGGGGCKGVTNTTDSSFSATGNAVVFTSSISDQNNKGSWSGVIFEGAASNSDFDVARASNGAPTVTINNRPSLNGMTVGSNAAAVVSGSSTLTIEDDGTLSNRGTLTNNGTIINKGTITNNSSLDNAGSIYVDGTLRGAVSGDGAVYYPLTLNTVDGTINSGDIKYYNCKADTTLPTDVTKANFTFKGWHDNAGCTGNAVASITANTTTGKKEYWANWEADSYTVTLDTNGGAINSGNIVSYTYGVGATLPTDVTKAGYTFAGWYDNADCTGSPVEAISGTETGAKTFYANWTANTNTAYKVEHYKQNHDDNNYTLADTDNLTGTTDASVEPAVKSYTGFTAPATRTVSIAADGSTVVKYYYTRNSYTVTLDTNGGAINSGNVSSYTYGVGATLPTDVTKSGYKFDGWYDSTDAAVTAISATDTGEKTFYAKWTAVEYDIIYKLDGGTNDDANPAKYTVESDTITLKPGKKSGYAFAGWYEGDSKVTEIAKGSVGNKTLTAKWNYVPPSDPSYNVPGSGEGGVAVKVTVSGSTAVVAEISASALESAAGSGAASITIDLSGLSKGVTQAQLTKTTVDKLLDVVMNAGNAVESVTVNLGGAVLTLDAKALAAVAGQVKGANVTLGVKESTPDSLNSAQKHALSPFEVVQLYFEAFIKSGGVEIHDFGGGSVRVSVAFEPAAGHDPARYVVLYVGEDGQLERFATAWAAGMLSFTAPHFSAYAVVYVEDATAAAIEALEALPMAGELKASQAKEAVKKAQAALESYASLTDGQKALVDDALIANAQQVVVKGDILIAKADKKAVGKVKNKAFSVKAGTSKSIYFKTLASAAGTKVTYKKASGSSYITVSKAGKVTAKKGMKKGKTYTAKVKVTCGKSWKYVKVTVKVQ